MICISLAGCSGGVQPERGPMEAGGAVIADDPNITFYAFTLNDIDGRGVSLSRYEGKVLLVVNVASECRFTHQYANLQRLYMKYRDRGFVVLGFPANNFGHQEPGTNAEIKAFTSSRFGVLFPLFSKISVAGEDMEPLYQYLTRSRTNADCAGPITWNFNKFLIGRDGTTLARFGSEIDPMDPQVTAAVEAALE